MQSTAISTHLYNHEDIGVFSDFHEVINCTNNAFFEGKLKAPVFSFIRNPRSKSAFHRRGNVGWIILIDHAGLARAMAYCSAAQIISLTMIGCWRGETVTFAGWLAAILVCLAVLVASSGGPADPATPTLSEPNPAAGDVVRSPNPSNTGDQN